METLEFEVRGIVPPRNVKRPSMWNNKKEIPRIIALRKMAYECFKGREPFIGKIKLDIEIHIPQSYNEPGDLDNFIKGICDALSRAIGPLQKEANEMYSKLENIDFHPKKFWVIWDDRQFNEINARLIREEADDFYYKIRIEGRSDGE